MPPSAPDIGILSAAQHLAAIEDAAPLPDSDLSLIDELPYAPGLLAQAPDDLRERLAAAFAMQAVYRQDTRQATLVLTITDTTPGIIAALLHDPRIDSDTATTQTQPGDSPTSPDTSVDVQRSTGAPKTLHRAQTIHAIPARADFRRGPTMGADRTPRAARPRRPPTHTARSAPDQHSRARRRLNQRS